MSNKKPATQATMEATAKQENGARHLSIAEARRMAFAASEKARRAQVTYAEEEARRSYDYKVEE